MSSPQPTNITQSNAAPSTQPQEQSPEQKQEPKSSKSTSPSTTSQAPSLHLNLQDLTFRHPRLPTITLTNPRRPLPQSQTFLAGRHSCLKASATTSPDAKEMVEMEEKRGGGDDDDDDGGMGEQEKEKDMEWTGDKKPFVTRGGKIFVNVQK